MTKLSWILFCVFAGVPAAIGQTPEEPVAIAIELTASEDVDSELVPLPGLAIEVHAVGRWNMPGWTPIPPGTFITDTRGVARGELELPTAVHAGVSNLKVDLLLRVRDSRFRYEPIYVRLFQKNDEPWHARVRPARGGTLRGRVVDQQGQPTAARLTLENRDQNNLPIQPDEAFAGLLAETHAFANASGEFELHYTGLGFAELRCQQTQIGAASPIQLVLNGGLQPTELELQLQGQETVAGRLTDRRGVGIADVRVLARLDGLPLDSSANGAPGIAEDHVQTDSNGGFRFAGLQPGNYIVQYGGMLRAWVNDGLSCTVATGATGTTEARLVFPASLVELKVLDLDGTPKRLHDTSVLNLPYFIGEYQLIELADTAPTSTLPWARFGECRFGNRHDKTTRNRRLGRGEFMHTLTVTAGQSYRLRLLPLGGPPSTRSAANDSGPLHPSVLTQDFRVDPSEPVTQMAIQQTDPAKLGTLQLVVPPEFPAAYNGEYVFAVRRSHENDTLFDAIFDGRKTVLQLEPGEYVVLVTDSTAFGGSTVPRPSAGNVAVPIFKQESTVRIEAGAQRIVQVRPIPQGRLQLELQPATESEPGRLPTIQLRSLDTKTAIETRWIPRYDEANPEAFELGETRVALEVLAPGQYEIEITCEPFKPQREAFAIQADMPVRLRVDLKR